jgi:hypothetical protein
MPNVKGPKATTFEWTRIADKAEKLLPQSIHADFIELRKEMCAGSYPPGRNIKTRKGNKKNQPKIWQAKLSGSYRVTFTFKKGTATFLNMGPHHLFD